MVRSTASGMPKQVLTINHMVSTNYLLWPKISGIQRNLSGRIRQGLRGHLPEAKSRVSSEDAGNV